MTHASNVLCTSWPWPLTFWPHNKRFPGLMVISAAWVFEISRGKTDKRTNTNAAEKWKSYPLDYVRTVGLGNNNRLMRMCGRKCHYKDVWDSRSCSKQFFVAVRRMYIARHSPRSRSVRHMLWGTVSKRFIISIGYLIPGDIVKAFFRGWGRTAEVVKAGNEARPSQRQPPRGKADGHLGLNKLKYEKKTGQAKNIRGWAEAEAFGSRPTQERGRWMPRQSRDQEKQKDASRLPRGKVAASRTTSLLLKTEYIS